MFHFRLIITLTVMTLICTGIASAHPSDGMSPRDIPNAYGTERYGYSSEFNINDLTFTCPYPDPTGLTDVERYMLAGCTGDDGTFMVPWFVDIFQMVNAMYSESGTVPSELRLGEMRYMARGYDSDSYQTAYDKFRSPITNEFPRLDAVEFAPGQIYMRPLTADEMAFFASKVDYLDDAWNKQTTYNSILDSTVPVNLKGGVFYIRVYGEEDVLLETIIYNLDYDDGIKASLASSAELHGNQTVLSYNPIEESWDDWLHL